MIEQLGAVDGSALAVFSYAGSVAIDVGLVTLEAFNRLRDKNRIIGSPERRKKAEVRQKRSLLVLPLFVHLVFESPKAFSCSLPAN